MALKITYNAPFTITFSILATAIFLIDNATRATEGSAGILSDFILLKPPFSMGNPYDYIALVGHTLGHSTMSHLIGNLSFILLLGPVVESRYGTKSLLMMVAFTAIATGLLHCLFYSQGVWGASGIVFMLITLSAFHDARHKEIPLTFILITILFIGKEIYNSFQDDEVSQFAHILGGLIGAALGFWSPIKKRMEKNDPLPAARDYSSISDEEPGI